MSGVERAAAAEANGELKSREAGRTLARLLALLPQDRFVAFGPRILGLYKSAKDDHWLWHAEALLRRMGDLGPDALAYLLDRKALLPTVNGAGVEGICRVGVPAKLRVEPTLIRLWNNSKPGADRDLRTSLFVAMRRIGITPPDISDHYGEIARIKTQLASVSSRSSKMVCSADGRRQISPQTTSSLR